MDNFNIIDTNGIVRELTTEQFKLVKHFSEQYDVDAIMYLNKICRF